MGEPDKKPLTFGPDAMNQYTALGNELRFYADQRFKIETAFLVVTGLLANVAKDHKSFRLMLGGMVLSYLCLSWDNYTARWWGILIGSLQKIETNSDTKLNQTICDWHIGRVTLSPTEGLVCRREASPAAQHDRIGALSRVYQCRVVRFS